MTTDATKDREFWLKLILWVQEEARGEHQNWKGPVDDDEDGPIRSSSVWPFQAQRWLTSLKPVIVKDFLLVCEYAGIEKDNALELRRQMRSLYGVVGGKGWAIARRQNAGGK
jgi:hypothetical protein